MTSRVTDCALLLTVLRAAHGRFVEDLYGKSRCMVHSRIADLRKQGHQIECRRFGYKDYRYRIVEGHAS
jgi:biotin operon repressor